MERSRKFTSDDEFLKIMTPAHTPGAKVAFFPGCNVYRQPDEILNALDIMDAIDIPYSFIPGMQYCCGLGTRGGRGDTDWLQGSAEKLIQKAAEFGAETVVCWCATCSCYFKYRIDMFIEKLPFQPITFGKYILQNIDTLSSLPLRSAP